jgi:hypothetical protein
LFTWHNTRIRQIEEMGFMRKGVEKSLDTARTSACAT